MSKNEVSTLYKEIQSILYKLIPEKWESLYLYASVVYGTGEMYFYYFPKRGIFKTKPVSCYEIANKFGINEEQYNTALTILYNKIKLLNNLSIRKWTNITISIVNCLFTIEYNFNNLIKSTYTDEQRHIYWQHKYLNIPVESLSKENQKLIKYFQQEENINPMIYTEGIYIEKNLHNKNQSLETNIIKEQKSENKVRNPILKY